MNHTAFSLNLGKRCIILDDIIDTGGSICVAAAALKEKGAKEFSKLIYYLKIKGYIRVKNLENKHNILSGIVRGIFGVLWSLATFFIIPVMVYENLGVFKSIERSIWLIKNSWGESVSATFTFHIIGALVCLPFVFLVFALHSFVAIILFVLAVLLITCVFSTAETIFVALAYQYATNMPVKGFENVEFKKIFDILPN